MSWVAPPPATKVDRAETERNMASAVNAARAWQSRAGGRRGVRSDRALSFDYVFNRRKGVAYHEFDTPVPLSKYRERRLAGERAVQRGQPRHFVASTAGVYEPQGHGFAITICRLAMSQREVKVVDDELGAPAAAEGLAQGMLRLIESQAYGTR